MSPENLTNVYNNNPTLQSQYSLQQYLDLFGQGGTTQPDPDPDPDPTPDPDPDPTTPPIQSAGSGGGGGIQGLQLTYTPGAQLKSTPAISDISSQNISTYLKDPNLQAKYANSKEYDDFVQSQMPQPNFLQRGITGVKDFFGKFNSGPKVRGTLGDRRKAAYDAGQKLPSIFAAIGRMQSPFNPDSRNYNPNMANQLNYLEGMDGTKISGTYKDPFNKSLGFTDNLTGQSMIGRDSQSGLMKYGPGTVLEGKNVISGFGSNDYETALEKYLEKMMSYKTKTVFQQKKIDRANQELKDYREQQKIKDQEKKEQNEREQRTREANTAARARAANPDVYASADRQGFTNPGGGFKSAGTNENFSNKSGKGRTGYLSGGRTSYFNGGIASFKNGGRTGYFKGALADTKKGKSMSPGTTASGNFRGGNGGGGNNTPPPTPPPKKPKPKVKKNISKGSFFPSFNFLKKFRAHDKYTDQLKASEKPNYHELGGLDFMARFPNLNPDIAKGLASGYQNMFEVGRALADGPGGMTVGNALNKAKEESRLNAVGIDAYANPDSSLYQNYFNQDPLTGAVPFNNQSMATGGRVNYFNGGIVSLRRR